MSFPKTVDAGSCPSNCTSESHGVCEIAAVDASANCRCTNEWMGKSVRKFASSTLNLLTDEMLAVRDKLRCSIGRKLFGHCVLLFGHCSFLCLQAFSRYFRQKPSEKLPDQEDHLLAATSRLFRQGTESRHRLYL